MREIALVHLISLGNPLDETILYCDIIELDLLPAAAKNLSLKDEMV